MKARPYVYKGKHNITNEFYIGYREKNTECGLDDLAKYRTSSKNVNPVFNEFNWEIIAEFENGDEAYDYEQQLIYENWGDPLLLNKNCHHGQKRFKSKKGRIHSEETKKKIGDAHFGKQRKEFTQETLKRMSLAQSGKKLSETTKEKIRVARTGSTQSQETIAKRVAKNTGKKRSPEICKKIGDVHRGKVVSDNTKLKMSQMAKNRASVKFKCPYCNKEVSKLNFARWHDNNCKHKNENV